jgi:hypothetical protein
MAHGDPVRQKLEADVDNFALALDGALVSAAAVRVPVIASNGSRCAAAKAGYHRQNIDTADSAGSLSSSTGCITVGNFRDVWCHIRGVTQGATMTIALALYDEADAFMGITPWKQFVLETGWTDGTDYISTIAYYDVGPAAKCRAIVGAMTGTTPSIEIYLEIA